jgi:uncharacterized protein YndB with AHSA1/START domain
MAKNISIIRLNTSKEKVWDALTKPELVKRWQYGSDLITNWEVGSSIRFRTEWDGKVFEQWGQVLEVQPPELLKFKVYFVCTAPGPGR